MMDYNNRAYGRPGEAYRLDYDPIRGPEFSSYDPEELGEYEIGSQRGKSKYDPRN